MGTYLARAAFFAALVLSLCSCGGNSGGSTPPPPPPPPPPPAADFLISVITPTVTAQQGGTLQLAEIQATPLNGFKGTISTSFSGLPAEATITPSGSSSSITLSNQAQSAWFQVGVAPSSPVGSTTVTISAVSGTITHSATFSLVVTEAAPFQIHVSPAALSMTPASTATVQISLTANGGAAPELPVNVTGPPNNSQVSIGYPQHLISPTYPVSFSVLATALAQPLQNYPITVVASDSANNTSMATVPLTVTVPFATGAAPTRSTFFRTDKSPTGMVYDPLRKLVFVSVEILNEVEVISSVDGHEIGSIPVDYPSGIDEAADGSAVYIVSPYFEGVTIIDPTSLQVVGHASVPQSVSGSSARVVFFQVVALSNGKVLLSPALDSLDLVKPSFYLWDPSTNSFSRFGPNGLGPLLTHSADRSKVIAVDNGYAGSVLYDVNSDSFTGPTKAIGGSTAINSDGSQVVTTTSGNPEIFTFYDSNFNVLGTLPAGAFWTAGSMPQFLYSRDDKYLYIVPDNSIGVSSAPGGAVAVVDTKTFSLVGLVPAFSFGAILPFSGQWITTFALDETNMLFGAANGGVGLLDLNSPTALLNPIPIGSKIIPSFASNSTSTQAQLQGTGFSTSDPLSLFFGAPPSSPLTLKALNVAVQDSNNVTLTIPAGGTSGPVNATLASRNGFFQVLPDAVSFGPVILRIDADAGSPAGGDAVKVIGYGLSAANTEVSIGGRPATITKTMPGIYSQPFPTETLTVTTPVGSPGWVDVTVNTPNGSATKSHAFQYVNSVNVYPTPGALDAIVYDDLRKRLYVTNEDHNQVEIFDLATNQFLPPIPVGSYPTSLALTPDRQLLAVSNLADGTGSVIDLAKSQVVATYPLLTSADLNAQNCAGEVVELAPAAPHRMVVSVNCTALLEVGYGHLIDLDTGSLSCTGIAGCESDGTTLGLGSKAPALASSRDGTKVFFTANSVGVLDFAANTIVQYPAGRFYDAAANSEGDVFAAAFGTYDAGANRISIMAYEPYIDSGAQSFNNVVGEKLNPSGSLLFFPQKSGVDLFDVQTGRLRLHIMLPDPLPFDTDTMALDEDGTSLFLISNTGITIAKLFQVPLSLGVVEPTSGSAGTVVTLKGSGFQSGTTVTFGDVQVPATYVDVNALSVTLPSLANGSVRITIRNPDGTLYALDNAFTVN